MRFSLLPAVGGLLLAASPLGAQVAPATLDSIARRIVAAARYATFATIDAAGHPQVRTI